MSRVRPAVGHPGYNRWDVHNKNYVSPRASHALKARARAKHVSVHTIVEVLNSLVDSMFVMSDTQKNQNFVMNGLITDSK